MKHLVLLLLLLALVLVPACSSNESSGDGDSDTGTDSDTDVDSDTDSDTDTGSDTATSGFEGTWFDEISGFMWQEPPGANASNAYTWQSAQDYCESLVLAGFNDWRLPSISEYRTLIRECPQTEPDGACQATDSCLEMACQTGCSNCTPQGGPAEPHGCYFSAELYGNCIWFWWSSSSCSDSWQNAWGVDFMEGDIAFSDKTIPSSARCLRGPL